MSPPPHLLSVIPICENWSHLLAEFSKIETDISGFCFRNRKKSMLSLCRGNKQHKQSQLNIAHFITLLVKHVYSGTVFTDFITFLFSSASAFLLIPVGPHNVTSPFSNSDQTNFIFHTTVFFMSTSKRVTNLFSCWSLWFAI